MNFNKSFRNGLSGSETAKRNYLAFTALKIADKQSASFRWNYSFNQLIFRLDTREKRHTTPTWTAWARLLKFR